MNYVWRRALILTTLGAIVLGALALVGFWHPNMPADAMRTFLPSITLPTVIVAGAVDGINPCAFTVLLLFITAIFATVQAEGQNTKEVRSRLLGMGAIYISAIFLTYLGIGVGS
ncbi:MAG: hypothetical protein ACYCZF_03615 [Anaerolineae bacterium]